MPWLIPTIPNSSASETRITRELSRVKTYATSPYSVALASARTSSSLSNVAIGATGPKISSWKTRADVGTSTKTVGA